MEKESTPRLLAKARLGLCAGEGVLAVHLALLPGGHGGASGDILETRRRTKQRATRRAPLGTCQVRGPPLKKKHEKNNSNLQGYLLHSFQGSFFLENLRKPTENGWFLKRTMVEKNGESTPRKPSPQRVTFAPSLKIRTSRLAVGDRTARRWQQIGKGAKGKRGTNPQNTNIFEILIEKAQILIKKRLRLQR